MWLDGQQPCGAESEKRLADFADTDGERPKRTRPIFPGPAKDGRKLRKPKGEFRSDPVLNLLLDQGIPTDAAPLLRALGYGCNHVAELGM
jgi:hypothetical protein